MELHSTKEALEAEILEKKEDTMHEITCKTMQGPPIHVEADRSHQPCDTEPPPQLHHVAGPSSSNAEHDQQLLHVTVAPPPLPSQPADVAPPQPEHAQPHVNPDAMQAELHVAQGMHAQPPPSSAAPSSPTASTSHTVTAPSSSSPLSSSTTTPIKAEKERKEKEEEKSLHCNQAFMIQEEVCVLNPTWERPKNIEYVGEDTSFTIGFDYMLDPMQMQELKNKFNRDKICIVEKELEKEENSKEEEKKDIKEIKGKKIKKMGKMIKIHGVRE